jgi:hypothetical protein
MITVSQKKSTMKNINPIGLLDDHILLEKLTKLGDLLAKLSHFIDCAILGRHWKKLFQKNQLKNQKVGVLPLTS